MQVLLPAVHAGVHILTAHATDSRVKTQLAEFYNRVAKLYGFGSEQWTVIELWRKLLLYICNELILSNLETYFYMVVIIVVYVQIILMFSKF